MIRVAIVEDDEKDSALLERYLAEYGKESGEAFSVDVFADPLVFLDKYDASYDIVFMDIELPDMNGMQASARLRKTDEDVMIIFVTNMAQFAVKASSGWINSANWANSTAKTGDMRFNKVFKAYLRHSDGSTTEIAIGDDVILTGATGNYSIMANWQYVVFDGLTLSAGDTFVLESLTPMENGAYLYWDGKTAPVVVPDGSVGDGSTQSTPNVDTITVFTGV